MTLRVAVTGAGGRMGREVLAAVDDREDCVAAFAVNRSPTDPVAGVEVADAADLPDLLAERDPDALVDFTGPDSSVDYVAACAEAGVPAVVGTTGFADDHRDALADAAESVPVLRASNFSRGVAALRRAVRAAAGALPGYDVEVTETHHDGKTDAPSGTAKTLLADVEAERPDLTERVHGREGDQPRTESEIGVHARRAGDVAGEHEVLLAGDENVLELTHRAGSRRVFAAGALDAAAWLAGRPAGAYDFEDVLDADDGPTGTTGTTEETQTR
ncbi:4-hydroxy-tetrahydrodipicolinate reductase [Candidatus Halobonum tyrrellensis]|uniref:4-hydroxy-tetrahydrodipicolinate reductase n=1 Tax=Candidatus Halobonum tyrrellensis G22 TaxID=1324957 RepID=V4HBN1_9EURY|nr:4-hydroxy-tetrahydrodipicolinate reductase [Candidatus Halobonum tyrrellensis]ESP87453.1 dihydrodipicolinate reductase [Candidatus Halobonum tyrrellensis G22]